MISPAATQTGGSGSWATVTTSSSPPDISSDRSRSSRVDGASRSGRGRRHRRSRRRGQAAGQGVVLLRHGFEPTPEFGANCSASRRRLGAVVAPREIDFQENDLPHTKSGKIMRRLLRARGPRPRRGRRVDAGGSPMSVNHELAFDLFADMVRVRRFEETCVESTASESKIRGFLHLYIGEEAVAAGVLRALRPEGRDRRDVSRTRAHADPRRVGQVDHGGDVWQGRRVLPRPGRIDAPLRCGHPLLWRQRHRRRRAADRGRARAGRQARRADRR